MDFKSRDDEAVVPLNARDERQLRDRTEDQVPARVVGERFDADQMNEDDDILPRRVVGEEMIDREVRDQVDAIHHEGRGPNSDVYNLTQDALRADPYNEDLTGIPPIEDEPESRDIMPDQIQSEAPNAVGDDDVELTARSTHDIRPINPDELPDG